MAQLDHHDKNIRNERECNAANLERAQANLSRNILTTNSSAMRNALSTRATDHRAKPGWKLELTTSLKRIMI